MCWFDDSPGEVFSRIGSVICDCSYSEKLAWVYCLIKSDLVVSIIVIKGRLFNLTKSKNVRILSVLDPLHPTTIQTVSIQR